MKDVLVEQRGKVADVTVVPSYDGERFLATNNRTSLVGGIVKVIDVPARIGESLEQGDEGALDGCLKPEGELGYHRITSGRAFLGMVDGYVPEELVEITASGVFETQPEGNKS